MRPAEFIDFLLEQVEAVAHDQQKLAKRLGQIQDRLLDAFEELTTPSGPSQVFVSLETNTAGDASSALPVVAPRVRRGVLARCRRRRRRPVRPAKRVEYVTPPTVAAVELPPLPAGAVVVTSTATAPAPKPRRPGRRPGPRPAFTPFEPADDDVPGGRVGSIYQMLCRGPMTQWDVRTSFPDASSSTIAGALARLRDQGLTVLDGGWNVALNPPATPKETPPPPQREEPRRDVETEPDRRSVSGGGAVPETEKALLARRDSDVFLCLRQERNLPADWCQETWAEVHASPVTAARHAGSPCAGCRQGAERRLRTAGIPVTDEAVDELLEVAARDAGHGDMGPGNRAAGALERRIRRSL